MNAAHRSDRAHGFLCSSHVTGLIRSRGGVGARGGVGQGGTVGTGGGGGPATTAGARGRKTPWWLTSGPSVPFNLIRFSKAPNSKFTNMIFPMSKNEETF
jgi:hypothetical protein